MRYTKENIPTGLLKTLKEERINPREIYHNPTTSLLYELSLAEPPLYAKKSVIEDKGALVAYSGVKTGRSPMDKRIVMENDTRDDVWWGEVNIPLSTESFRRNMDIATGYLNGRRSLYIIDAFACWREEEKVKVRIICARPYHALFMKNMLIQPTQEELAGFGEPDWIIYNAGECPANAQIEGIGSETSVALDFDERKFVILGTEYAGCMKKGVFTILNYILPKKNILSMHCSANEDKKTGNVTLFFGLSGTGKTTLSADPARRLIGDDEHGWDDKGIFNIEGGCYAKAINLTEESEPEIWNAIRYGTVLENVVLDEQTHVVDYTDSSITQNTRASYPLEHIKDVKIPANGKHPNNIIFLTCDAYGVLPPVSKLTPEQAMYHFVSGYTAKVAGTEVGIAEPEATFSPCFGGAFLVWHPHKYAELLKDKMLKYNSNVWLVNTGWYGGAYGVGERFPLKYTRSVIDCILDGSFDKADFVQEHFFDLAIPKAFPEGIDVPDNILSPIETWENKNSYEQTAHKLRDLFEENYKKYNK